MARVSRFTEEFDLAYTRTPSSGHQSQITLAEEKTALITSTKSVAKPKITTNAFAGAIKAVRRLGTYYKCHINELVTCNFRQTNAQHAEERIEAGSISSSSYGAPMTSEAELKRQSERYNFPNFEYRQPDDESSTFIAYEAKKQPTTTITKMQATAEPQRLDGYTIFAQAYAHMKSEIKRIEDSSKATTRCRGLEIEA